MKTEAQAEAIKGLQSEAYRIAADHGWHEKDPSVGEALALMHSEVSEALEEYRNADKRTGGDWKTIYYTRGDLTKKPEGVVTELADVVIRVLDFCETHGLDLAAAIELKMRFNETRPYKHGGKRL